MENIFKLDKTALRYVSHAMSTDTLRAALCGVQIIIEDETITYTATDGIVLLTLRDSLRLPTKAINTVIPADTIKAILKSKGAASLCLNSGVVHCAGASFARDEVGQYPDWKRLLWKTNTQATIRPAAITANILANIAKALAGIVGEKGPVACLPVFENPLVDSQYYMAISNNSLQSTLAFLDNRPGYLAVVMGHNTKTGYKWLA
jgi:hypothetical protein